MRFALSRALIHFALKIMPSGRSRAELSALFWTWNMKVQATLAASRSGETPT